MQIKYIDRATGEEQIESPPGEGLLKFFYHNPFGKLALNLVVKRKVISAAYGRMMDKPKSKHKIKAFVEEFGIDMSEAVKSIEDFTSFNDFFYRKLKPAARPIGEGIVSPGDGRLLAFEDIKAVNEFFVKGNKFTLSQYLQDEALTKRFENASMFIIRLAPNDYHRYHFPYDGLVSETHQISGSYFSVSPYALVDNFTRVFCENKREYNILKTKEKGDILLSPVGATMVGTIITTHQANSEVKKGAEMGYFAFGGSTVVMLVDKDKIQINADILANTKKGIETSIKMGEQIAV